MNDARPSNELQAALCPVRSTACFNAAAAPAATAAAAAAAAAGLLLLS